MAGSVRMVVRVGLLIVWVACMSGLRIGLMPLARLSMPLDRTLCRGLLKTWGLVTARLFGMRIHVTGTPPAPPFYLVSNHLTYFDSLVYTALLGCVSVAKSDVQGWPIVGYISSKCNVIFIDRARWRDNVRVNKLIAKAYEEGDGIIMFAESTTSRGIDVRPFKSALLQVAVENQWPVHCGTVTYTVPKGAPLPSEWIGWYTPIPFVTHLLRAMRQPRFDVHVTFSETPICSGDRKELAAQLHDVVQANFTPVE